MGVVGEGNGLVVESGGTRVLIDCGFGVRGAATRLARLGLEPSSLDALNRTASVCTTSTVSVGLNWLPPKVALARASLVSTRGVPEGAAGRLTR